MKIPGKRIKRTRYFESFECVVAVDVELVIPADDPSEPCYETETLDFLALVKQHAEMGDRKWLAEHGRVFQAVEAA